MKIVNRCSLPLSKGKKHFPTKLHCQPHYNRLSWKNIGQIIRGIFFFIVILLKSLELCAELGEVGSVKHCQICSESSSPLLTCFLVLPGSLDGTEVVAMDLQCLVSYCCAGLWLTAGHGAVTEGAAASLLLISATSGSFSAGRQGSHKTRIS